VKRSPWWYRQRFLTIGIVYFAGFFFGPIVSQLVGGSTVPSIVVLGNAFGPRAYHASLLGVIALTLVCWALRTWGGAYLRPAVVWNADALDDRLIVEGPFRFVRNPLYLGNVVLAVAMSFYATPIGAAIIIVGNIVLQLALISVEQPLLRERYGVAFDAYTTAVPALFPRPTPWNGAPSAVVAPSLRLGLRSEIFTAVFVIFTVSVAIRFWSPANL
jgi:protein-S-isoprenylcysteine O-methyltransferase Ste14